MINNNFSDRKKKRKYHEYDIDKNSGLLEIFEALKNYKSEFSSQDEFLRFYEVMSMLKNTEVFNNLISKLDKNSIKMFENISNTRRYIAKYTIYNNQREVVRHTKKLRRKLK